MTSADVVIVGGGVIGSSAAWQLRQDGFTGRIVVIERDSLYTRASAALAMGGIRQQFCTPVTVQMVQYSVELWKQFDTRLAVPGHRPRAWFRQRGYLFLADAASAERLMDRYEQERRAGAHVCLWSRDELTTRLPGLVVDDIEFGVFGPEDGYANPREVLFGFRHAAESVGVEYTNSEVTGIDVSDGRVTGVRMANGDTIPTGTIVNAAGAWAGQLARLAGLDVPIEPTRQMLFRCTLPHTWPYRFPMIVDPGGLHWRHDDPVSDGDEDGIIAAWTNMNETTGENFSADESRWANQFYPALVARVPTLRQVSKVTGWAGLYEMTPDHNPALGEHPLLRGFIFAAGFSGHGLMMSPATARIVSEMVRLGRSETFDVSLFLPDRFARGAWVHDLATI